jgi:ABC-type antimicrobial peptide transport system permease subunit
MRKWIRRTLIALAVVAAVVALRWTVFAPKPVEVGVVAVALAAGLRAAGPGLPVETPMAFVVIALAVSLAVGLTSGVLPARRAAALDPIDALRTE